MQRELSGMRDVVRALRSSDTADWLPQNLERAAELLEARSLMKAPWLVQEARTAMDDPAEQRSVSVIVREADPIAAQGATGDINLMLQTVNWKREINLSWLEFSRWGIQQLILISRLYYIKNPVPRRLVDVCAAYVFARGLEVTTGDEDANAVLKEFFERNKKVFGHVAMVDAERRKDTDGNLFWAFFADKTDKGLVTCRSIEALEIMDIITDPEDADTPWYYLRCWSERTFRQDTGRIESVAREMWYPAMGYEPSAEARPATIQEKPVAWDSVVYHRKTGGVGKWLFGCPRIYPMLDWAKEGKRYLEACAALGQALSQIAITVSTKGGQEALEAIKQQVQTTVGPTSNLFDTQPPAVHGSIFGSGPGTKMEAFKTSGAGLDPNGVRWFWIMCCMVKGVPPTFIGDMETSNLATATSLDRPTETVFISNQEEWIEDLAVFATYVLQVSKRAPSGRLQESLRNRDYEPGKVDIVLNERQRRPSGGWKYAPLINLREAAAGKTDQRGEIKIQVNFPSIREGDVKVLVDAAVAAGTLGNHGGQIVGIDEKALVKLLYKLLDIEDGNEIAEEQYPEGEYDPDRTKEVLPAAVPKLAVQPGVQPTPAQAGQEPSSKAAKEAADAMTAVANRLRHALNLVEAKRNGSPSGHIV